MTTHFVGLDDTSRQEKRIGVAEAQGDILQYTASGWEARGSSGKALSGTLYGTALDLSGALSADSGAFTSSLTKAGVGVLDENTNFGGNVTGVWNALVVGKIQENAVESAVASEGQGLVFDDGNAQFEFEDVGVARFDAPAWAYYTSFGTWATWSADSSQERAGFNYNSSNAEGDYLEFPVKLDRGTWYFMLMGVQNSDGGKASFKIDGVEKTTFDFYLATGGLNSYNKLFEYSGYTQDTNALVTIRIEATTANIDSLGNYLRISSLVGFRYVP